MGRALIVDIQNTPIGSFPDFNKSYYLERILVEDIPVNIALTPYQMDQWSGLKGLIKEVVSREGSGLLLEGLLHVCTRGNHKIRDPHHQSICTSWFRQNATQQQQSAEIAEGLEFLKEVLDIEPVGYVPPQHLWNRDTLDAVRENGLKYLVTNALFDQMFPYEQDDVLVVPSGSVKHGKVNNPVVHVYYDEIFGNALMGEVFSNLVSLSDIPISGKTNLQTINGLYLGFMKQLRDSRRLVNWCLHRGERYKPDADSIRALRSEQYERYRKDI